MSFFITTPGRVGEAILNLFYPPVCAGCNCGLPGSAPEKLSAIPMLCEECANRLPRPEHAVCAICAEPLGSRGPVVTAVAGEICGRCRENRPAFDYAVCPYRNRDLIEQLVHEFKYARHGRRLDLVRPLGALLLHALDDPRLAEETVAAIIPVPLHPMRQRLRGFNQAQMLGGALSQATGWPVIPALQRAVNTRSQTRFTREERQQNLRGAFLLNSRDANKVEGQTVVVLDDILTTGSTLHACAQVLMKAGARKVIAVALAKTASEQG